MVKEGAQIHRIQQQQRFDRLVPGHGRRRRYGAGLEHGQDVRAPLLSQDDFEALFSLGIDCEGRRFISG